MLVWPCYNMEILERMEKFVFLPYSCRWQGYVINKLYMKKVSGVNSKSTEKVMELHMRTWRSRPIWPEISLRKRTLLELLYRVDFCAQDQAPPERKQKTWNVLTVPGLSLASQFMGSKLVFEKRELYAELHPHKVTCFHCWFRKSTK